jgi:hypothetical protein
MAPKESGATNMTKWIEAMKDCDKGSRDDKLSKAIDEASKSGKGK